MHEWFILNFHKNGKCYNFTVCIDTEIICTQMTFLSELCDINKH